MAWKVIYTKQAQRDAKKLSKSPLRPAIEEILSTIAKDPYHPSQAFKSLVGDQKGLFSRRVNIQHRVVYEIHNDLRTVKVYRLWGHN